MSQQKAQTILFVSHSKEVGGAERYLEGLIGDTIRRHPGMRVQLVCRKDPALDSWIGRITATGATVHRLSLRSPREFLTMRRLIRSAAIAHLILAYPVGKYQLAAALLGVGTDTPLVITHQLVIDISEIRMRAPRRLFWKLAFRSYAAIARFNIVPSRAGLELLRRHGFAPARTELIYNGVDPTRFTPLEVAERASVRLAIAAAVSDQSWPDDAVLICSVARLNPQKGLFDLVDAASIVVRRHPEARFVVVGDGELRIPIEQHIATRGIEARFRLAGERPLDEVARWLAGCDLFVLSSRQEGLPFALIEAMAAGCPVVATSVGGVGEVVIDPTVGVLVPPADPVRLAEAIQGLVADAPRRASMANAGRRRILASFTLESCYEKTAAIYDRLMNGRWPQRSVGRPG